jgi:hypothetical protein
MHRGEKFRNTTSYKIIIGSNVRDVFLSELEKGLESGLANSSIQVTKKKYAAVLISYLNLRIKSDSDLDHFGRARVRSKTISKCGSGSGCSGSRSPHLH